MKVEEKETTSVDTVITLQSVGEVDMLYSALRIASFHPDEVMENLDISSLSKAGHSKEALKAFIETLAKKLAVI